MHQSVNARFERNKKSVVHDFRNRPVDFVALAVFMRGVIPRVGDKRFYAERYALAFPVSLNNFCLDRLPDGKMCAYVVYAFPCNF